ncbi:MAG: outer membrane protein assembly factor BamD [Desulfuromonadaceae bacterium]
MKNLLAALVMLLGATACAFTKSPPQSAEYYFQQGEIAFENESYDDAISYWEKARDSFYSPELNTLSEVKIAEAYFLSERYVEAATAYEDFLKRHRDNPRTAAVMFQLGQCYFNQMLSADRDQTTTRNALSVLVDLQNRFPEFYALNEVQEKIVLCQDRLAEHEMTVGNFYLRTKKYKAAVGRLEPVFRRFPNFSKQDETFYYLGRAYLMLGDRQKAADAFNALFRFYPASEYTNDALDYVAKHY